MIIKIAICSDEVNGKIICRYLEQYSCTHNIEFNIDTYYCGEELVDRYEDESAVYDILLIDSEVSQGKGIYVAKQILLEQQYNVRVGFMADSSRYMQQCFDMQICEYMSKPITYNDFLYKLAIMIRTIEQSKTNILVVNQNKEELIYVVNDIQCIETIKSYNGRSSLLITTNDAMEIVNEQLIKYSDVLEKQGFISPHRSCIVNMRYIHKIGESEVVLNSGKKLPLSRRRRKEIVSKLDKFMVLRY